MVWSVSVGAFRHTNHPPPPSQLEQPQWFVESLASLEQRQWFAEHPQAHSELCERSHPTR